jgi:hypothetical protein
LQASTTSPSSSSAALVLSEQQQIACVTRASVPSPFP